MTLGNLNKLPSSRIKTFVTILLLIFALPVGVIVMWLWTTWSKTAKWILTVLSILGFLFWLGFMVLFFNIIFIAINPSAKFKSINSTVPTQSTTTTTTTTPTQ